MAKNFVSPGVFLSEVDVSFLGTGVGAIGAALIGTAPQGPAFVPIRVQTFSEYSEWFGDLDKNHLLGYAARSYLKNAGAAQIVRVLGPAGRSVDGTTVTPGYTADSMWGITAITGSATANLLALVEITASHSMVISDLTVDEFAIVVSGSAGVGDLLISLTASFNTGSSNYIKKVLNTDPTKFVEKGYYLRDVYDYAYKAYPGGNAVYASMSYGITNFQQGFNSGSTPWFFSQDFGGSTKYNLFRVHTMGHGDAENGRFKISIKNVRTSANPSVLEFGKFDLEVRGFGANDGTSAIEQYPNLSFDTADPSYIGRVIGDKLVKWSESRSKMVEFGTYPNRSKLIRVEMITGSFPDSSLPWGFRGLDKPVLSYISGTSAVEGDSFTADVNDTLPSLPLVNDLKDKVTQAEALTKFYWGIEFNVSGNVAGRLSWLPSMTGSDTDFTLANVSGNLLGNLVYNASNPTASKKAPTSAGTSTSHTVLESGLAKFTVPTAFGFDGFDKTLANGPLENETQLLTVSQLGSQALRQAVDVIADPDFIDINLLAIPGIYSSRVVDYGITAIEDRADALYITDITGSTPTAVIQEANGRGFDTNYAAVYYPSIKIWDDVNKVSKVVPASIPAVGVIAFNDRVSYPWFAPAGLNRAGLGRDTIGFDVLNVEDQLKKAERDNLYEARVNPIARFPDVPQGVVWGQKTLQLKASALDRINVRRLLIRAKKLVASASRLLVFEPANATTMTRFKQLVNPILADIQQKQGLEAFKVVMDETTTTPELIDRNRLVGRIFLIPTRSAEFLDISFIVSPTGASFDE